MNASYLPGGPPDEHTFLCGYNRVRRYGTTMSLPDTKIRSFTLHLVEKEDTLQGLALKYDCPVSEIVRINKIWSAASLHLREYIRIPTENGSPDEPSTSRTSTPCNQIPTSNHPEKNETMKEILQRIDNAIKTTSTTVQNLQKQSSFNDTGWPPTQITTRHNSLADPYQRI